jgi:hypothetical protein
VNDTQVAVEVRSGRSCILDHKHLGNDAGEIVTLTDAELAGKC